MLFVFDGFLLGMGQSFLCVISSVRPKKITGAGGGGWVGVVGGAMSLKIFFFLNVWLWVGMWWGLHCLCFVLLAVLFVSLWLLGWCLAVWFLLFWLWCGQRY